MSKTLTWIKSCKLAAELYQQTNFRHRDSPGQNGIFFLAVPVPGQNPCFKAAWGSCGSVPLWSFRVDIFERHAVRWVWSIVWGLLKRSVAHLFDALPQYHSPIILSLLSWFDFLVMLLLLLRFVFLIFLVLLVSFVFFAFFPCLLVDLASSHSVYHAR